MRNLSKLIIRAAFSLILFAKSHETEAKRLTAVCHDISGDGVFYFTQNSWDTPNNIFIRHPDAITGGAITLVWEMEESEAKFSLYGLKKVASSNLSLLYNTKEQITFSGLFNEVPILFSFYPKQNVGVYSENSNWGDIADGVRAKLFTMECKFKVQ